VGVANLTDGWNLARLWRRYNNRKYRDHPGGIPRLCGGVPPRACAGHTIEGQDYRTAAETDEGAARRAWRTLRAGRQMRTAGWRNLPRSDGSRPQRMPSCGARISTRAAGRLRPPATSMRWPGCWPALSRRPPRQAATFRACFALFVQGRGWIGRAACLDISKVAMVLDTPPRIEVLPIAGLPTADGRRIIGDMP